MILIIIFVIVIRHNFNANFFKVTFLLAFAFYSRKGKQTEHSQTLEEFTPIIHTREYFYSLKNNFLEKPFNFGSIPPIKKNRFFPIQSMEEFRAKPRIKGLNKGNDDFIENQNSEGNRNRKKVAKINAECFVID